MLTQAMLFAIGTVNEIIRRIYFVSILAWKISTKQFSIAKGYGEINLKVGMYLGHIYPIFMIAYLLYKYKQQDTWTGLGFLTFVIAWAEVMIVTCILLLHDRIQAYLDECVYLVNQVFQYSQYIKCKCYIHKAYLTVMH